MGFRLVPKSVTLNGVIALILHYSTEFDRLGGQLHQNGSEYPLPVISWPKLTHAAVTQSVCDG